MCRFHFATYFLAAAIEAFGSAQHLPGQAYTPDHPKVIRMVDRGVAFMESYDQPSVGEYAGAPILVAYAMLKATGDVGHPKVQEGIRMAVRLTERLQSDRRQGESKVMYESAVAGILLASIDPVRYRENLLRILDFYRYVQKDHGGFGYLPRPTGDTSQVQYVVLALWTMHQVGIEIPVDIVERTIGYLKATRDPSGGWGYQGKVAAGRLVEQEGVTKSLSTAGAGALMMGGDILSLFGQRRETNDEDEGIPKAFKRIDLRLKQQAERRATNLSRSDIEGPLQAAVRYQNTTGFNGAYWYFYWRYSQERYEAFLEIVNGRQEKSPPWYNAGVTELASLQSEDGSWGKEGIRDLTPVEVNTAFAVLFLIRSTQKAIGKLDEGFSIGGYGLPTDVTRVQRVGDRLISPEETSVQNLLSMLENEEANDVEISLLPENMRLSSKSAEREEQLRRLSRLLSSRDYRARRIAAKLLGRSDDLSVVPDLIYALSDPDKVVPVVAEEGLRLLSRKLSVSFLDVNPTDQQRRQAQDFWKKWYLGLRPDYVFIEP